MAFDITSAPSPIVQDGFVPVIDISTARGGTLEQRTAIGRAIDRACRDSGFFVIVGHGVDAHLIQQMHNVTLDFFKEPEDWKQKWSTIPGDPTIRGLFARSSYVSAGEGVDTAPDLCELFTVNQLGEPEIAERAGLGDAFDIWSRPNVWPDRPIGFRDVWTLYYSALSNLALDLMGICALGLELDEGFFEPFFDYHISNMTANWYPPVATPPLENQYRKGPHSDWGTLTILYQDATGGLQVLDKAAEWRDVPVIEGGFVVNIGDLMARWTNDAWVSTKHRVVPPAADKRSIERVSVPFFHQPSWSSTIQCLPSCQGAGNQQDLEPTTSGAYLLAKIRAAFGG